MPKVVDHEQRRAEIADAVRRVLIRDGLAQTTVRAVVAESGMSSGAIRHYFANHAELIRFAVEGLGERVSARVRQALQAAPGRTARTRAIDALLELVPADVERQAELQALVDLVRMPGGVEWGEKLRVAMLMTCRAMVNLLANNQAPATDRPLADRRLERLAERLQLLLDGIAMQSMLYGTQPDERGMRRQIARAVDGILADLSDR